MLPWNPSTIVDLRHLLAFLHLGETWPAIPFEGYTPPSIPLPRCFIGFLISPFSTSHGYLPVERRGGREKSSHDPSRRDRVSSWRFTVASQALDGTYCFHHCSCCGCSYDCDILLVPSAIFSVGYWGDSDKICSVFEVLIYPCHTHPRMMVSFEIRRGSWSHYQLSKASRTSQKKGNSS